MNKIIFASVLAVATALVGSPSRAEAGNRHHDDDDEVIAAIGGFIGGVIVGATINNNGHVPPPPVGVAVGYENGHNHHRHGHWEWTVVRVWVPGRWVYIDRDCSRPRRVWIEGHYDRRRERVWVAHRDNYRCDRGCR